MTLLKKCSFLIARTRSFVINMPIKNNGLSAVLLAAMLSFSASAVQVNDKEKYIVNSCNAYTHSTDDTKVLACGVYIRGFFYGLLNSANTDVLKIEKNSKSSSSFVERAYANRVGRKPERKSINYSCITVDELKVKIVANLSDESRAPFHSISQINTFLVNTLTAACTSAN